MKQNVQYTIRFCERPRKGLFRTPSRQNASGGTKQRLHPWKTATDFKRRHQQIAWLWKQSFPRGGKAIPF